MVTHGNSETARDEACVADLRSARTKAVELSRGGELATVLSAGIDDPMSRVYVVKLLDVHPALGKVAGRRVLADIGLAPFARVVDLTASQKANLLLASGEGP